MKIWNDIATTALMGTERHTLRWPPEPDDPLVAALHRIDAHDSEAALLAAAGIAAVYRKAGLRPNTPASTLPPPALEDTMPECSAQAAQLLSVVIGTGEFRELLPEALNLLTSARQRIPAALLPDFLDIGRNMPSLREPLARVIGNRGVWLAGQNQDWSYLAKPETVDWSTATREQRLAMLTEIGLRDPAEARDLLLSTWSRESADDRAALLSARSAGLSPEDEEFLEAALDDRSAGVRLAASSLLARLPRSAYVRRMVDRLTRFVKVKYKFPFGHALEIELPSEADPSMVRDGVDSGSSSRSQAGQSPDEGRKAGWLRHTAASVPPQYWSTTFEIAPEEFIKLAEKSDWSDPLLRGLSQSVNRYPVDRWTLAILGSVLKRPVQWQGLGDLEPAIARLPAADLEPVILDILARTPLGAPSLLRGLLMAYPGEWPSPLARAVVDKIAKTLANFGDHQTLGAVSAMIRETVLKMPPSMSAELAAVTADAIQPNTYHGRIVDQALKILYLRNDLRHAILNAETFKP